MSEALADHVRSEWYTFEFVTVFLGPGRYHHPAGLPGWGPRSAPRFRTVPLRYMGGPRRGYLFPSFHTIFLSDRVVHATLNYWLTFTKQEDYAFVFLVESAGNDPVAKRKRLRNDLATLNASIG